MLSQFNNEGGFTLAELLVVLSIVSILTATSIPTYKVFIYAAYASAQVSQIRDLRTALEAGMPDLEEAGQSGNIYSGRIHPGPMTVPNSVVMLPGAYLGKNMLAGVNWNPDCKIAGCDYVQIIVLHCITGMIRSKAWLGNGQVVELFYRSPSGCPNGLPA